MSKEGAANGPPAKSLLQESVAEPERNLPQVTRSKVVPYIIVCIAIVLGSQIEGIDLADNTVVQAKWVDSAIRDFVNGVAPGVIQLERKACDGSLAERCGQAVIV